MRVLPALLLASCAAPSASPMPAPTSFAPASTPISVAPPWFPSDGREWLNALDGLALRGPEVGPDVSAPSVVVYDLDREQVLFERSPDEVRSVASLTKLVSSLAMSAEEPDLDQAVCITPEHWPPAPGARSRMVTGTCYRGWDLLGAALVKSDNRAAMALGSVAGLSFDVFVDRMNDVASELGMTRSSFEDPVGIGEANLSTARDMVRAVVAVAAHPDLAPAASAATWHIETLDGERVHDLPSTNRLATRGDLDTVAAKTGYTDPARHCYAVALQRANGQRLAIVVLGAEGSATRFADVDRILSWLADLESSGPDSGTPPPL